MPHRVALVTGGASGMGLAVATALAKQAPNVTWTLHLLDLNSTAGEKAASSLPNAHFHKTNVTDYSSLSSAFDTAYTKSGRLDFVYANAGIVEKDNFYEEHAVDGPPPEPNQLSIDVNFKSVVNTAYLALHYFRKTIKKDKENGEKGDKEGFGERGPCLVMTASCGGLYPSEFCPMYSGSKAAVIHFNRAITFAYHQAGVRTYATAPGTIKTNLLAADDWETWPPELLTPIETLVDAVAMIVEGGDMQDATDKKVAAEEAWGLTVEVNRDKWYFREAHEYCDKAMKDMMHFTGMRYQAERMAKAKERDAAGQ